MATGDDACRVGPSARAPSGDHTHLSLPFPDAVCQTATDARLAAAVVDRLSFHAHILKTGAQSCYLRVGRTGKGAAQQS